MQSWVFLSNLHGALSECSTTPSGMRRNVNTWPRIDERPFVRAATCLLMGRPVKVAIALDDLLARRIVIPVQREHSVLLRLNQFRVHFSARLATHSRRVGTIRSSSVCSRVRLRVTHPISMFC